MRSCWVIKQSAFGVGKQGKHFFQSHQFSQHQGPWHFYVGTQMRNTRERSKVNHKVWGCECFLGRRESMQAGGKQGELRVETLGVEKLSLFSSILVLGAKTDTITRPS